MKQQFDEALKSAFGSFSELEQMFDYNLDTELNEITTNRSNMNEIVKDIRKWAEKHDKIREVIEGALEEVPGNTKLKVFKKNWLTQKSEINVKGDGGFYIDNVPNTNVKITKTSSIKNVGNGIILQDIDADGNVIINYNSGEQKKENKEKEIIKQNNNNMDLIKIILKGDFEKLEQILEYLDKNEGDIPTKLNLSEDEYQEILKWLDANEFLKVEFLDFKVIPLYVTSKGKFAYKNKFWSNNKTDLLLNKEEKIDKEKILFLSANPTDEARLQTDKEYKVIKERLKSSEQRDSFELLMPELALTIEQLVLAMNQKPEIVHFSGHGEKEGIIITNEQNENQLMPVRPLKRLFKQHKNAIKLVVLNACYSSRQAETISGLGFYVIGMKTTVEDEAAISFATGLYIGLGAGKEVETAFDDSMIILETKFPSLDSYPEVWKNGKKLEL